MSKEDKRISKYLSMKAHSLEKIDTCHNHPEKSLTAKINKHTTSRYSLFTHCSFDVTKNRHCYLRQRLHEKLL